MTKKVRIEDADTSGYKVVVQTWNKGSALVGESIPPDTMQSEKTLSGPTDLQEMYIHSTQYLVIKEA